MFTVAIITVDKIGVDELGVDELGVDELGVDEMETYRLMIPPPPPLYLITLIIYRHDWYPLRDPSYMVHLKY